MTNFKQKKNNAKSTIVGAISDIATSVTVSDASEFPITPEFVLTIWDKSTYPDPTDDPNAEIVNITGIAGNILTIQRAQENTIAQPHLGGNAIEMLITAGQFQELQQAIQDLQEYSEVLSDDITYNPTVFTTFYPYISGTSKVFLNGLRQEAGIGKDYTETGVNEFTFTNALIVGDSLIVDYKVAS